MKTAEDIRNELFEIAEPVCEDAGYELVDLRYLREQSGWVVRAFIDHPDGITFTDCEQVSRELSAVLDVEDPIPNAYNLEVSSPGVDRPLRKASHFRRFIGETARVVLAEAREGRKRFKGIITAVTPEGEDTAGEGAAEGEPRRAAAEQAVVLRVDGQEFSLPIAEIATAKLVPDWDALSRKPGGSGGGTPSAA